MARSAEASRTVLVCTARNTSPDDNEALAALAEELDRRGVPGHHLELTGLGVEAVGELLSSAAGRDLDDRLRALAAQVQEETAGNPLFVDALLSSLRADATWSPGELPRTLAETVARRVAHLPGGVGDLLRVASVIGLDFDLRVAALGFEEATLQVGTTGTEALELLDLAEAALPAPDSSLRALTVAALARALHITGRRDEALDRGEQALAMARRLGDSEATAGVIFRTLQTGVTNIRAGAPRAFELLEMARELEDDELRAWALTVSLWASAILGDTDRFAELFPECSELVEQLRQPVLQHPLALIRHFRALLAGDLDGAEQMLEHADEIERAVGWGLEGQYGLNMFLLRREQGRLAGLAPTLRALVRLKPPAALWRPGMAALYAELGMLEEARAEFEHLADGGFAALPTDDTRRLCLGLLAEVCAAIDDAERALWLLEQLRPSEGQMLLFWGVGACLGPADRLLAMLASAAGWNADAERWYARALELSRRFDSPLWIGHCLCDCAVHLRAADPARARQMLDEAAVLCARYGLVGLEQKVAARLETDPI